MKLNFLNIMNKKSTPDELAQEIVSLEAKEPDAIKECESVKKFAKDLRQRKLCGEVVTDEQIKNADRNVESALLDLEAVQEMLGTLMSRLILTYEEIRNNAAKDSQKSQDAISDERLRIMDEIAKAKARLFVLAEVFYGPMADRQCKGGYIFLSDSENDKAYNAEVERLRTQVKHPTYYLKRDEIDRRFNWSVAVNPDDEAERLVNKYRPQAVPPASEQQSAGAL